MMQDNETDPLITTDFVWGISTSSYQIEGSVDAEGRGPSIWDRFCAVPGSIADGSSGAVACNSYRRWPEDIELLKELGVRAYRFSIAWPRIQPEGRGQANQPGLDWYRRLADSLLEAGIEPWAALYHWDMPQALEDVGGWPSRDTALRFADYAAACFEALGTSVKHWITMNEPWCSAFLGYALGEHAPGRKNVADAYAATHHLLLGHGLAVQACRKIIPDARIGIVINPAKPRPATARPEDVAASLRASVGRTGLWLDPLYGREYPTEHLASHAVAMPVLEGDMLAIATPTDFLGVNYYNEDAVRGVPATPDNPKGFEYVPTWQPKTAMGWDIVPGGLERILDFMNRSWPVPAFHVTENGMACEEPDACAGRIHDSQRIDYHRGHLEAIRRSIQQGIPVRGYFAWTLMDNFEWAFGYTRRFGMVGVDRTTGNRVRKDSFFYYRDVIAGFGY
jgi:beta-glucosidase